MTFSELIIRDCAVIDTTTGDVSPGRDVRVFKGRVVELTTTSRATSATNVHVIDAHGGFLLPGLIDMHVHTGFDPHSVTGTAPTAAGRALIASENLRTALQHGVTTLRDVGSEATEAQQLRDTLPRLSNPMPRLLVAGQGLTAIGGHGNEYGTTAFEEIAGSAAAQEAVDRRAQDLVDLVKVIVNGPGTPHVLSADEVTAVIAAAHGHGLRVAAHAHLDGAALDAAIIGGADTVEHGMGINGDQVAALASRRGYLTPTLVAYRSIERNADFFGGADSDFVQVAVKGLRDYLPVVADAHRGGVRILAGTDAGNPSVHFGSLHDEIRMLADECGLGNLIALQAATVSAAAALGDDTLGHIHAGAAADLIVLDGDPLADLGALRTIQKVIRSSAGGSNILHLDRVAGAVSVFEIRDF